MALLLVNVSILLDLNFFMFCWRSKRWPAIKPCHCWSITWPVIVIFNLYLFHESTANPFIISCLPTAEPVKFSNVTSLSISCISQSVNSSHKLRSSCPTPHDRQPPWRSSIKVVLPRVPPPPPNLFTIHSASQSVSLTLHFSYTALLQNNGWQYT